MVRKTTAQSEIHTKSNASVVLQGDFLQVVDTSSGSKTTIFYIRYLSLAYTANVIQFVIFT